MAKDKAARDARAAFVADMMARVARKMVRASTVDAFRWAGPFLDERGREYFQVSLLPPYAPGAPWRVCCSGNDDTSIVRVFLDEERARAVYDGINDFTQMKTLRGRGFKED